jgi:sugar-specific transcriptional regulator TrmB
MYKEYLAKSGLSKDQATIYDLLLQYGNIGASKLSKLSGLKRGLTYKILEQLTELGLAEKNSTLSSIALFFPTHPSKIKELFEKKKEEAKLAEEALNAVMGQMVSTFNLASGKPNVQFFEGLTNIEKVVFDPIESGASEILEYLDDEAVINTLSDLNRSHVQARKKAGIKKRILAVDCSSIRNRVKEFDPNFTEVRLIKTKTFATVMQIYDNKVSYITLNPERIIGVIIEGKEIFEMHKALFEESWVKAEKIS